MRFYIQAFLILLLMGATVLSEERPTVSLNPGALTVDETAPAITYANFISVPVSQSLSLPAKGYMIELYPGESATALNATTVQAEVFFSLDSRMMDADIPTSADDNFANLVIEHFSEKTSIEGPVRLLGETVIDNKRYAEFLLFPATSDSLGKTTFWESIFLYVGSRLIAPDELLPRNDVAYSSRDRLGSALGDPGIADYVIVTSAELADAFDLLVRYKTETGLRTRIKLVEEIISEYTGRDDAEKLRQYLKTFRTQGGRYVLLGGDDSIVPIRYAYYANTNSRPSLEYLQVCDLYFADLTGDWDVDMDGVWGEPFDDRPDLTPELLVGRLPFTEAEEVHRYTSKLINYEMTPGGNDREYLSRSFFFSSDQMRDFGGIGQHGLIASTYPEWFSTDTATGVEAAAGNDLAPINTPAVSLGEAMTDGYGIINVIAHGRRDGFAVKSSGYNNWPKEFLLTSEQSGAHSSFDSLSLIDKPAFYYSLACETGRFDSDGQSGEESAACMARYLLGQDGGAVGFVAYSRWGWVNSSYLLHRSFFDSLFAYPESPAIEAMYASKNEFYFIRDNVYGQNYLGDPTLKVYVDIPASPDLELHAVAEGVEVSVSANGLPVSQCLVVVSHQGAIVYRGLTDPDGEMIVDYPLDAGTLYKFTAVKTGMTVSQVRYLGSIATGVEDGDLSLPESFSLGQNYPNPFNPRTIITFDIPRATRATLSVFNTLGRHVATLLDQSVTIGHHTVEWDAVDTRGEMVASGVYFYRLETESSTDVRKMILLR
jgi:hypothetical protein